uniref:Uncharacterized protein n=1 Tax=Nelumbo nucifera TaxID=4432 RepID=A0A822XVN3_NELNU|nr:TPA_asm: hypothetical protein HUJ06_024499 [Nelumbo nucifera]
MRFQKKPTTPLSHEIFSRFDLGCNPGFLASLQGNQSSSSSVLMNKGANVSWNLLE